MVNKTDSYPVSNAHVYNRIDQLRAALKGLMAVDTPRAAQLQAAIDKLEEELAQATTARREATSDTHQEGVRHRGDRKAM